MLAIEDRRVGAPTTETDRVHVVAENAGSPDIWSAAKAKLITILEPGKARSHITGLDDSFSERLAALVDSLPADMKGGLTIFSSWRSPQRQAEIIEAHLRRNHGSEAARKWLTYIKAAKGDVIATGKTACPWLRSLGVTRWVGVPGGSNHQRGLAVDLHYKNVRVNEFIHRNAGKFGLTFPMPHEDWHLEPVTASDLAPNFYPVLSSLRRLIMPFWAGCAKAMGA